jgi:hypothetical protein
MYNEQIKKSIMKWRVEHKDEYNQYMREQVYLKHSDKIKEKRMKRYYLEKEFQTFRNILF